MPRNVDNVKQEKHDRERLAVLSLEFQAFPDRPDWPLVAIKVDGHPPFENVAKEWRSFDPAEILSAAHPLLPGDLGHRVALSTCSCGEAGCGVIAPFVVRSPDRRRISWVDFRDYVGVFAAPIAEDSDRYDGKPWPLDDLHFDRAQYEAEVARASADLSWETPRRRLARLVREQVEELSLELPPNLTLRWVTPAWNADGVELSFEKPRTPESDFRQQVLRVRSQHLDPVRAATEIVGKLAGTPPEDRYRTFGRHR